jgi:hypothetical protein
MAESNQLMHFPAYVPNVLSLGGACQTRFQIERWLRATQPSLDYPTFFFDWLYLGGIKGVIWMLENGFSLFETDFQIHHIHDQSLFVPRHRPSGFAFMHDFGGYAKTYECAEAGMHKAMHNSLTKFNFLARRTKALIESSIPLSFIYQGQVGVPESVKLSQLLSNGVTQRMVINVLSQDLKCNLASLSNVHFMYIDEKSHGKDQSLAWTGNDQAWDSIFQQMSISPCYLTIK